MKIPTTPKAREMREILAAKRYCVSVAFNAHHISPQKSPSLARSRKFIDERLPASVEYGSQSVSSPSHRLAHEQPHMLPSLYQHDRCGRQTHFLSGLRAALFAGHEEFGQYRDSSRLPRLNELRASCVGPSADANGGASGLVNVQCAGGGSGGASKFNLASER